MTRDFDNPRPRETAMAAAMKAAGIDPDIIDLRLVLARIINHGRISEGICHREISSAFQKSSEAMGSLPNGLRLDASSRPPMPGTANGDLSSDQSRGAAPRQPQSEVATVVMSSDQHGVADLRSEGDEVGHVSGADPASAPLPASSPSSPELLGGAASEMPEGQSVGASVRQSDGGADPSFTARPAIPPVSASSPPKRLTPYAGKEPSALARKVMGSVGKKLAKVTVGYRVRDGRYLTDVTRGELRRLAQENRDEATVLQSIIFILDERHPDGSMLKTVGELIETADLQRAIARAQDIEHA